MDSFDFGRTFTRIFHLIRDTMGSVGMFTLAISILSGVVNAVLYSQLSNIGPNPDAIFQSPIYWFSTIFGLLAGLVGWGGAIAGMLASASGIKPDIGLCLRAGLAHFLPVLALFVLWMLGVMIGWILLIVPGLILITMWSVSLPALIAGDSGVFGSFGRSRYLTKGSRWPIFALLVVALLAMYAVLLVSGLLAGASFAELSQEALSPLYSLLMIPAGWLVGLFIDGLLVSLYVEAVAIKEGGNLSALREVFT